MGEQKRKRPFLLANPSFYLFAQTDSKTARQARPSPVLARENKIISLKLSSLHHESKARRIQADSTSVRTVAMGLPSNTLLLLLRIGKKLCPGLLHSQPGLNLKVRKKGRKKTFKSCLILPFTFHQIKTCHFRSIRIAVGWMDTHSNDSPSIQSFCLDRTASRRAQPVHPFSNYNLQHESIEICVHSLLLTHQVQECNIQKE